MAQHPSAVDLAERWGRPGTPKAGDMLAYQRQRAGFHMDQIAKADGHWNGVEVAALEDQARLSSDQVSRYLRALSALKALAEVQAAMDAQPVTEDGGKPKPEPEPTPEPEIPPDPAPHPDGRPYPVPPEPEPARRCPICGGLNPGDMTHVRCM